MSGFLKHLVSRMAVARGAMRPLGESAPEQGVKADDTEGMPIGWAAETFHERQDDRREGADNTLREETVRPEGPRMIHGAPDAPTSNSAAIVERNMPRQQIRAAANIASVFGSRETNVEWTRKVDAPESTREIEAPRSLPRPELLPSAPQELPATRKLTAAGEPVSEQRARHTVEGAKRESAAISSASSNAHLAKPTTPRLTERLPASRAEAPARATNGTAAIVPKPAPLGSVMAAPPSSTGPDAKPTAPSVHVTIGRVEIRATTATSAQPKSAKPAPTSRPSLSLADYLARRNKGP